MPGFVTLIKPYLYIALTLSFALVLHRALPLATACCCCCCTLGMDVHPDILRYLESVELLEPYRKLRNVSSDTYQDYVHHLMMPGDDPSGCTKGARHPAGLLMLFDEKLNEVQPMEALNPEVLQQAFRMKGKDGQAPVVEVGKRKRAPIANGSHKSKDSAVTLSPADLTRITSSIVGPRIGNLLYTTWPSWNNTNPFLCITKDTAPGLGLVNFGAITKPMDLDTMKTKLARGAYSSYTEFVTDFGLMINNVRLAAPPDAPIVALAREVEADFSDTVKKMAEENLHTEITEFQRKSSRGK